MDAGEKATGTFAVVVVAGEGGVRGKDRSHRNTVRRSHPLSSFKKKGRIS